MRIRAGIVKSAVIAVLVAAPAAAPRARAAEDVPSPRSGFSLGGRGMYFKPKDAGKGSWSGGAQARIHFTSVIAVEASADYRQNKFAETTVDVYPLQGSLMLYLLPHSPICPYILGGAGWYYTHVRKPFEKTEHRFGPHAGAGLEVFLSKSWSLDGSYRYVWNSSINQPDAAHPLGKDYTDSGSMVTAAINFWF